MVVEENNLKVRLMAMSEAVIDKLLSETKPAAEITLTDIENLVFKSGQDFREQVQQELVSTTSKSRESERPTCQSCNRPMHDKGERKKALATENGELEVARTYYYCPTCKVGIFPPR